MQTEHTVLTSGKQDWLLFCFQLQTNGGDLLRRLLAPLLAHSASTCLPNTARTKTLNPSPRINRWFAFDWSVRYSSFG